jgi:hypothetical protein
MGWIASYNEIIYFTQSFTADSTYNNNIYKFADENFDQGFNCAECYVLNSFRMNYSDTNSLNYKYSCLPIYNISFCESVLFGFVYDLSCGPNFYRTCGLAYLPMIGYNSSNRVISSVQLHRDNKDGGYRYYYRAIIFNNSSITYPKSFTAGPIDRSNGDVNQLAALHVYCYNSGLKYFKFNYIPDSSSISYTYECLKSQYVGGLAASYITNYFSLSGNFNSRHFSKDASE